MNSLQLRLLGYFYVSLLLRPSYNKTKSDFASKHSSRPI